MGCWVGTSINNAMAPLITENKEKKKLAEQNKDQGATQKGDVMHLGEDSEVKARGGQLENKEEKDEAGTDDTKEATSHGAAGTLTGANERACQEP
jgi:hypothetical protein